MCGIGGGESGSSGDQNLQSGFSQLPGSLQQSYIQYGNQLNNLYSTDQSANFQLPTLNAGATNALNQQSNQAFAVTPQSVQANLALQQNPWDSSVINQYNQQANGQQSNLNQAVNQAGQFGSNRAILGANDIDMTRLNNIGAFQQGEYNTQLQNALTTIPAGNLASSQAAVSAGQTQQQMQYQNQQAPYAAMQSYAQNLGVLPTTGGTTSSGSNSSQAVNGEI